MPNPIWAITLRHRLFDTLGSPTILVYTMGKVGSSTVYTSLKNNRLSPLIYHVHFMSKEHIERIWKKHGKTNNLYNRINILHILKGNFDHITASSALYTLNPVHRKWKIISLVRDPVETIFSHVFQNPQTHRPHLIGNDGKLDKALVENYIIMYFSNFNSETDYIANWFADDFHSFTGIDIYSKQFEYDTGYTIINNERFDVVIISLEYLEQVFTEVISKLLGKKLNLKIVNTNIRNTAEQGDLYRQIKKELAIPRDCLSKVYSTNYAKHFFSPEHREDMINKWSKPRENTG